MSELLKNLKISVIGLGYVGLPLAVEFGKKYKTIGFDINKDRISELDKGYDRTVGDKNNFFQKSDLLNITSKDKNISDSNIYIVTVPTPVDKDNKPDMSPIASATKIISKYLNKGDIVIFESTVYPGATEEYCVPILEEGSKLKYNKDFYCGYSPERINPGDDLHSLTNIVKITSGSNKESAQIVDTLYKSIITAGTHKVSSIAVAEAAKVIENIQRDVNIALINELSILFNKLGMDTTEILEASGTKWNFLNFRPGLVGGHCIGVDPYYLTYKAAEIGFSPEIILAGRKINDKMGDFIAESAIEEMNKKGIEPSGAKVCILGLTFKENCPDLRNTKVISIIKKLKKYNCDLVISDYCADLVEAKNNYNINLKDLKDINDIDVVIIAVGHDNFKLIKSSSWEKIVKKDGIIMDVKSIFKKDYFINSSINHWRL